MTAHDIDKYFSQMRNKKFNFKDPVVVEENIDFSYKGMGMSDALSYKYNRENFNRQVAKNAKNVK